mgnify:CR=1 FL=1
MLKNILHSAVQSRAFNRNVSLESFKNKLASEASVITNSFVKTDSALFMLSEQDEQTNLVIVSQYERALSGFSGESLTDLEDGITYYAISCPLDNGNACQLRKSVPHTAPSVLDCRQSFGTGDRIGNPAPATPWHIEACESFNMPPVLAQQSVRENHKTGRTFQQVLDDVTWSVFGCGYTSPWGADADHLKNLEEIEEAARVGFTMFTLDPSDMIDNDANTDSDDVLKQKLSGLFENNEEVDAFISRYEGTNGADARSVVQSGVTYLAAIRHGVKAYSRLIEQKGGSSFNFEMSIDETSNTTSVLDHHIIVTELTSAGVNLFSLAPRFEGAFEKGIDYRGDLGEFRRSLEKHVSLACELGEYRMSLHSGSDKFSIYPAFGEITDGFFHVKTAGTSYIEALKAVAQVDIDLFRKILTLSIDTFHENVKSYQISADVSRIPRVLQLKQDDMLELIANDQDTRQVLHIAYGVVLGRMGEELKAVLRNSREFYRENVVTHIKKHLTLLTGISET